MVSRLNQNQKEAIETTEGPLLIIAGPGTGKTHTLVMRIVRLIKTQKALPENLFVATFTEKSAKEIITRVTNELIKENISINLNEMYIGTFHSICLKLIKENLEFTRVRKNFRTLDSFDQIYTVYQNIRVFKHIPGFYDFFDPKSVTWNTAKEICRYVNLLSEEAVKIDELSQRDEPSLILLTEVYKCYLELLEEHNLLDFSSLQTIAYELLSTNLDILNKLKEKIKYVMIDEYQDTNYIQEKLIFLLNDNNICVVGDDDQGLYRFRGATIRNILEFPNKFSNKKCKLIKLVENYRSNKPIVDFYNHWIRNISNDKGPFDWDEYRYDKEIVPHNQKGYSSPTVLKLSGIENGWYENITKFIKDAEASGKITDRNQIAFLFSSVGNKHVKELADHLENEGINVYSPRSDMFFSRIEIKLILGCLILVFPNYVKNLEDKTFQYDIKELYDYYGSCVKEATEVINKPEHLALRTWLKDKSVFHIDLKKNTDYAFSGLLYELFQFSPFKEYLDVDCTGAVNILRDARNISLLIKMVVKYEYLHRIDVLTSTRIEEYTNKLFNLFLKQLYREGLNEYEDDSEYAPSGCISFMTIHQAKGLEFPVVFVDSLGNCPRERKDNILTILEDKVFKRKPFEPKSCIKYFDFWRLYYTAFSRAQNLLILTYKETNRSPSKYFTKFVSQLPKYEGVCNFEGIDFDEIKPVNLKNSYSFTSDIIVYENCSLQYKFYKELDFTPVRSGSAVFGLLVHQTIEDIHRAAIRKEEYLITEENIKSWFNQNYNSISKKEASYLGEAQLKVALEQVLNYTERSKKIWSSVHNAEVNVSLVKSDYIINGTIDLIKTEQEGIYDIVDFKSEKKPDIEIDKAKINLYKRQLQLYAYLIEERHGINVRNLTIYYTGEKDGLPEISFKKNDSAIHETMEQFDKIVNKIEKKEYATCSTSRILCTNCDFRFYCGKSS